MSESNKSRTAEDLSGVTLLGNNNTTYSYDYNPEVLETFVNKHPDNDYIVTFDAYEFTSKCPKTGQPDFAKVVISYIPNERMVESKSLKLYLFSFRNHGSFHEDCMNTVLNDLYDIMYPKYIEVIGIFAPRGGIAIHPWCAKVNPKFPEYKNLYEKRMIDNMNEATKRTRRYDE